MGVFDAKCPYCGEEQEINHDDGYGYAEDETYQQQCWSCEKNYTFTTAIIFDYSTEKAECLNGGAHDWKPTFTYPIEHTKGYCSICGETRKATKEDMLAAVAHRKDLHERLEAQGDSQ